MREGERERGEKVVLRGRGREIDEMHLMEGRETERENDGDPRKTHLQLEEWYKCVKCERFLKRRLE